MKGTQAMFGMNVFDNYYITSSRQNLSNICNKLLIISTNCFSLGFETYNFISETLTIADLTEGTYDEKKC